MSIEDRIRRLRGEWPALLAVVALVVGHLWYYGVRGADWRPIGLPLLVAIVVFVAGEGAKRVLAR